MHNRTFSVLSVIQVKMAWQCCLIEYSLSPKEKSRVLVSSPLNIKDKLKFLLTN